MKVRLDNGVQGFIKMSNLSDSNVINPEERVQIGQKIYVRILQIRPERLSVSREVNQIDKAYIAIPKKRSSARVKAAI